MRRRTEPASDGGLWERARSQWLAGGARAAAARTAADAAAAEAHRLDALAWNRAYQHDWRDLLLLDWRVVEQADHDRLRDVSDQRARERVHTADRNLAFLAEALQAQNRDAVAAAIRFLEADPWFFRSGYAKERLIRRLVHLPLSPDEARRLRTIVLRFVDEGKGEGLTRAYARLARAVDSPALRAPLSWRTNAGDLGRRRRAAQILATLEQSKMGRASLAGRAGCSFTAMLPCGDRSAGSSGVQLLAQGRAFGGLRGFYFLL